MSNLLKPAIPTSTGIIYKETEPWMVAVLRSTGKHGNKLVLPGGKVKVGHHNWLQTLIIEAKEEISITDLKMINFFCIGSKPLRDVRILEMGWYLDGNPMPDNIPCIDEEKTLVEGYHAFDMVFTAVSNSEPVADGIEGKEAFYVDVNNVNPDDYALDHGHILVAYAHYLKTGNKPALDQF